MKQECNEIVYGVSLSVKACRQYGFSEAEVLGFALHDLGLRRFRLMTYWNECEKSPRNYDFSAVEGLIGKIGDMGGEVTLCLGLRQPRWPECHPPKWTKDLSREQFNLHLYDFIEKVVEKFKGNSVITSYQLENEALNHGIGQCVDYSRSRLREEFALIKRLDPGRHIIMSTSDSWGLPLKKPRPDMYAFSLYRHQWTKNGLSRRHRSPLFQRMRKGAINFIINRPVICHELQMEPWGPKGTEHLSDKLQLSLMGPGDMQAALDYAHRSGFSVIDMWGLEWWYWRMKTYGDSAPADVVKNVLRST